MINSISATVLFVKNLEKSVSFYRDILGFSVKNTDDGFVAFDVNGHEFALMDINNASKMISSKEVEPEKSGAHRVLIASFVEDTDKVFNELSEKGVIFIKEPTTQPWGQRTAYFKDPDGNIWEISHFIAEE